MFARDAETWAHARDEFDKLGAAVLGPPFLAPDVFAQLRADAVAQRERAWLCDFPEIPGRSTRQFMHRAEFGALGRAFLESPEIAALIAEVTGAQLVPCYSASSYTYYEQPGDVCGRHVDRPGTSTLSLLITLDADWGPSPSAGVGLDIETVPPLRVTSRPNRAVLLHGSRWPHTRPPLGPGERVWILSCCYGSAP
jgi:hypothetical protein